MKVVMRRRTIPEALTAMAEKLQDAGVTQPGVINGTISANEEYAVDRMYNVEITYLVARCTLYLIELKNPDSTTKPFMVAAETEDDLPKLLSRQRNEFIIKWFSVKTVYAEPGLYMR